MGSRDRSFTSRIKWAGRIMRMVAYQSPSTVVEVASSGAGATWRRPASAVFEGRANGASRYRIEVPDGLPLGRSRRRRRQDSHRASNTEKR